MPELMKSFIVRQAEKLTPKQIDDNGIGSHPDRLQSSRYKSWMEICKQGKYEELDILLKEFLEGSEAIQSFEQIPVILRKPLEFANYHGYEFTKEDIFQQLELGSLQNVFGEADTEGHQSRENIFLKNYTNLADQLIAEAVVSSFIPKDILDIQNILKTLLLIERIHFEGVDNFNLNIGRLYDMPIILPSCFFDLDRCKGITPVPTPKDTREFENSLKTVNPDLIDENEEPDCGCGRPQEKDDCECKCDETCVPQDPCCAKIVPYIADLYIVKDEISCYEVGEMSYIENVLQTETRERIHRNLVREESHQELEETTTSFEERDHQVDERFSLQKEIDKTTEQTLSSDAGVTAHQKWGTGDVTATTNVGYNQSKKEAQKSIQDNAKQVITKSITSLEKKVRTLVSSTRIQENEEINKHVFENNKKKSKDISRQFYYVNQVKKGQVYNYGKRELLDFYLPEPSELYKRLIEKKFKLKKPEKPCVKIIEISADNYLYYVKCLGLKDVEFPPEEDKVEILNFKGGLGPEKTKWGKTFGSGHGTDDGPKNISVPEGYVTHKMETSFGGVSGNSNVSISITLTLANSSLEYSSVQTVASISLPILEGTPSVTISYLNITYYSINLKVTYKLKAEALLKWQLSIYEKIMEAYGKELAVYNEALAEFERTKQIKYRQNPLILLQDIQEQLKQASISYISCQFFDDMDAMKHKVMGCGFPQFSIREAKKEGEYVRFFEQAFEWEFMNFIFYPYFWGRKCSWEDKMNEEADNMLFQRFLKAGFVRVSVSVRPGFEDHVNYYLKTRKIWGKTGKPPIAGPDFVPIYQEIKEDKDNFNAERAGTIDVKNKSATVILNGTDYYWDYGNKPALNKGKVDADKIALDINREIFIECKPYKIIAIIEHTLITGHTTWEITLDRLYEGADDNNLPWSTGAVFIGAPWEFKIPTRLVWLREGSGCLPCYPIICPEPKENEESEKSE